MSAARPSDGPPELPPSRVLSIQRLADGVFWPFVLAFVAVFLNGVRIEGLTPDEKKTGGLATLVPRDPLPLALSLLLVLAYLALAIGLTKALAALGRRRGLAVAFFLALPALVVLVSAWRMRAGQGALGYVLLNVLYASPAAVWILVRRDVEERIEEFSSLRDS